MSDTNESSPSGGCLRDAGERSGSNRSPFAQNWPRIVEGRRASRELDRLLVLGDLEEVAQEALSAWAGPGERAWAAQALVALRRQGLLENDELDHARRAVLLSSSRSCAGPC